MNTRRLELEKTFSHSFTSSLAGAFALASLIWGWTAAAAPRWPLPPFPEPGLMYSEHWDEPYQMSPAQIDPAVFVESWSGYALNRSAENPSVAPWSVPLLTPAGRPNVDCRGAIRFWYRPEFGPGLESGDVARLLTLVTTNGSESSVVWSLVISEDRSELDLVTESAPAVCLRAGDMAFQAGGWVLLTLGYTETNSALWLNDSLIASGAGLPAVPAALTPYSSLIVGSGPAGTGLVACGQIDELAIFSGHNRFRALAGHPYGLSEAWDIGLYYANTAPVAALGQVSAEELAAQALARAHRLAAREAAALLPLDNTLAEEPAPLDPGSGCCGTNSIYDVWLTNPFVWPGAQGRWSASLSIGGGTNGALYDVFRTTTLEGGSITNMPWVWLTNGFACDTVTVTNEPDSAFYILGTPLDSDGDGIPDAYSALVHDGLGPDSNGNGVPDWLEAAMGFDPRRPNDLGKSKPGYGLFLAQPQGASALP